MVDQIRPTHMLKKVLADTYSLEMQTQNFQWNCESEAPLCLQTMFAEQTEEYSMALEMLAESIHRLNQKAPATFDELKELSSFDQVPSADDADGMIGVLIEQTNVVLADIDNLKKAAVHEELSEIEALAEERSRVHTVHLLMLELSLKNQNILI